MNTKPAEPSTRPLRLGLFITLLVFAGSGCAAGQTPTVSPAPTTSSPTLSPTATPGATASGAASVSPAHTASPTAPATPEPTESDSGTTTGGDIPDNAVFLRYTDATHAFSIKYVEGWQVTPQADGVVIRDKDSSEIVQIVAGVTDIAAYIANTDLPALQATPSFSLVSQDKVTVGGQQLDHLVYHSLAPPDPVTGKEVPSTVDRYYVPGTTGMAVVSLSTPDGVDNVDAFREMINSFKWM